MDRLCVRLSAAVLAATTTLGVLAGVAALAELGPSRELPVVVLPAVVVTGSRSAVLAEVCNESIGRPENYFPFPFEADILRTRCASDTSQRTSGGQG